MLTHRMMAFYLLVPIFLKSFLILKKVKMCSPKTFFCKYQVCKNMSQNSKKMEPKGGSSFAKVYRALQYKRLLSRALIKYTVQVYVFPFLLIFEASSQMQKSTFEIFYHILTETSLMTYSPTITQEHSLLSKHISKLC